MNNEDLLKQLHWFTVEGPRSAFELGKTLLDLSQADNNIEEGDGHPVIVMPGFGAGNGTTFALRKMLNDRGHNTIKWDHGRNLGFHEDLTVKLVNQINDESNKHGTKVSIVGQSLGGTIGRIIARMSPHNIKQIITMGAPINGLDGVPNMVRHIYDFIKPDEFTVDDAWEIYKNMVSMVLTIPSTSIYSKSDGVVPWTLSVQEEHELTENVEVDSSHIGMGFNLDIIKIVAERLAKQE